MPADSFADAVQRYVAELEQMRARIALATDGLRLIARADGAAVVVLRRIAAETLRAIGEEA